MSSLTWPSNTSLTTFMMILKVPLITWRGKLRKCSHPRALEQRENSRAVAAKSLRQGANEVEGVEAVAEVAAEAAGVVATAEAVVDKAMARASMTLPVDFSTVLIVMTTHAALPPLKCQLWARRAVITFLLNAIMTRRTTPRGKSNLWELNPRAMICPTFLLTKRLAATQEQLSHTMGRTTTIIMTPPPLHRGRLVVAAEMEITSDVEGTGRTRDELHFICDT